MTAVAAEASVAADHPVAWDDRRERVAPEGLSYRLGAAAPDPLTKFLVRNRAARRDIEQLAVDPELEIGDSFEFTRINYRDPLIGKKLCEYAFPAPERAAERSVINLLRTAAGAPGLQDGEAGTMFPGYSQCGFSPFPELPVDDLALTAGYDSIHYLGGYARRGKAPEAFRADGYEIMVPRQGQNPAATVVTPVVLASFAKKACAHQNLHNDGKDNLS